MVVGFTHICGNLLNHKVFSVILYQMFIIARVTWALRGVTGTRSAHAY